MTKQQRDILMWMLGTGAGWFEFMGLPDPPRLRSREGSIYGKAVARSDLTELVRLTLLDPDGTSYRFTHQGRRVALQLWRDVS